MTPLDPAKHSTPLAFFLATNRKEIKWLGLIALCYVLAMCAMLAATYYVGKIVDLLSPYPHGPIRLYVIFAILGFFGYELGFRIGHILEVLTNSRLRAASKKALFDHVTSLSFGYFADRFSGQIAHKISATTDALERVTGNITNEFVEDGAFAIVSAIALSFIHPYYGIFVMAWTIVLCLGVLPYAKRMNARANQYADAESKTSGVLVDFFTNITAVKVYGTNANREAAYEQIDAEKKAYRKLGVWAVLSYNFMGLAVITLSTGFLLITVYLYAHALITVGEILFVTASGLRIFSIAWDLGKSIIDFIRARGEAQQNLADLIAPASVVDGAVHEASAHEKVSVQYQGVTFAYGDKSPVLEDFSLTVPAGQKLGIVGLSGAGKTTFANLLLRFFDVQKGVVALNGTDVRELSQAYLRSHISYISQDTSLFHMTIRENIAYGMPDARLEDVEHAAKLAYANEFIDILPEKYDSVVGERGVKLSGGQRQRIAIARAILANRPLFLLDEATSALDSDSEGKIQKGLTTLMEGKTVIAIAHRLSTLSYMDRIIYLEAGAIAEEGTHEELLTKDGKYAKLWHMQAGGFLPS